MAAGVGMIHEMGRPLVVAVVVIVVVADVAAVVVVAIDVVVVGWYGSSVYA